VDDVHFDLDFHVRELALPSPGSGEQLGEQVARITSRPLDRARPLWELYLIHGLRDGCVAMLTKIHHALIDGISGAEIMGLLLDLGPDGPSLSADHGWTGEAEEMPGQVELLARAALGVPRYPRRMLRALPRAIPTFRTPRSAPFPVPAWWVRSPRGCAASRPAPPRRVAPSGTRPPYLVQRANLAAPPLCLRPVVADRGQGDQESPRVHGQ